MSLARKIALFAAFLFLTMGESHTAFGQELYESNLSVRALGMGNAYTSVVSDAYSLHYNPARLAEVEGFNFRLMDPYVTVSDVTNLLDVIDSNSGVVEILDEVYDEDVAAGLGARLAFTMPRFGVALFSDVQLNVDLNNPVLPDLDLRAVVDYGVVVGGAIPIVPGIMEAGIAVKRVIRQGGAIPISATTIAELDLDLIEEQIENRGSAFGLDLGLSAYVPVPMLDLTASFVWRNVGGLSFQSDDDVKPPSDSDEMILSFAGGFDVGLAGALVAIDFKYLEESEDLWKRVHFGTEVNLLNLDLRAGFHQGYYTLGVGVNLGLLELDLATYGVELGEYAGQREDRRYALQLTLELGVDPFFSLGGEDGARTSKRRGRRQGIKQRR